MSEEGRRPTQKGCGKGERACGEERSGTGRPQTNSSEKEHGSGEGGDEPVDGDACHFGKAREVHALAKIVASRFHDKRSSSHYGNCQK